MAREATIRRRRPGTEPGVSGSTSRGSSDGAREASAPAQQQQPDANDTLRQALRQLFVRSVLLYVMYHYYWKKPSPPQPTADVTPATPAAPPAASLAGLFGFASRNPPPYYAYNLKSAWVPGREVAFRVFVGANPDMSFREAKERGRDDAVWAEDGVKFATVLESYLARNVSLRVPEDVCDRNGTWYAHIFLVQGNFWNAPAVSDEMIEKGVLYTRHDFVKWLKVDPKKKEKNLLGANSDEDASEETFNAKSDEDVPKSPKDEAKVSGEGEDKADTEGDETLRYDQVWKPTMPIQLVTGSGPLVLGQLPPAAAEMYRVDQKEGLYYPPFHVNEFWMLRDSLRLMNDTVREITVEMSFSPISRNKWILYKQFDSVWQKQVEFGAMQPDEPDELKRMFIETNPYLLATTMVVSVAHSVLEILAFKSDVSHWKNIKSMEGVSVRSMIWKIVMEAIIFLYLWDNDTSWMITIGSGIGLGIGIWKLGKAVKFENFGKRKLLGFIPWFDMSDRESYSKKTKEYDEQAMKYLGYALYPLITIYALYSLRYQKHKSWYSWVINSLVGAVYAFGFIMMFPQIFINYKLKSVAHMPMKAMMYKTLNTIIDDLFSFIIKMPWLHRLACFRDDIVFLILLYQRWIYPVDTKRVNEFGQKFDEDGTEKTPVADPDVQSTTTTTENDNECSPAGDEVKDAADKKND